jgi:hypothetical protein
MSTTHHRPIAPGESGLEPPDLFQYKEFDRSTERLESSAICGAIGRNDGSEVVTVVR